MLIAHRSYTLAGRICGNLNLLNCRHASSAIDKKKYSHTLKLPSTTFPLRHKCQHDTDLKYRHKTTIDLYQRQRNEKTGPEFILHDGPPYANGNLHMGHALNRTLKDIINRYQLIRGRRIHYVPGWDCHGLPIEQKALQEAGTSHLTIDPLRVREIARKTALEAIEVQKSEMKEIGIMADWDSDAGTYRTMTLDFEVRQMRLFANLVTKGLITHRLRPVYYSPSSRTALAEAELKYKDGYKSRSVYVAFPITRMSDSLKELGVDDIQLAIWTTTPWTLPANMAVMVSESLTYALVSCQGRKLVVAEERIKSLEKLLGSIEVLATLPGSSLIGCKYSHRFYSDMPVISSRHVSPDSGTGLVHSAPAHGHEDYEAYMAHGDKTELRCPVDDAGCFTEDVGAPSLVGKSVLGDGVGEMISLLQQDNTLLAEEVIEHRYPHDWKTKEPIIVRATPQWFADVSSIKPMVHESLDKVEFYPAQSRNRLEAFVNGRAEWCISRQRSWGVPIPALYQDGKPLLDTSVINHVINILAEKGTDYWWEAPVDAFIPANTQGDFTKGTDTLDVWYDSGSSWTMLPATADVYLEGSDQHRGWFQSSLLTHVGSNQRPEAPFRKLITHGFILDEEGQKMSKSSGNGISPVDIVKDKGSDVLRLWAASVDYTRDVSMGPSATAHASESLRKIRSALRFMLANMSKAENHELSLIDRHILAELSSMRHSVIENYDVFAFSRALNHITMFLSQTMSALYFDIVKDVLYSGNGPQRAGAAFTLHKVFNTIVPLLAPITPHLAEELWEHSGKSDSIFLSDWSSELSLTLPKVDIEPLLHIRSQLLVAADQARAHGIKSAAALDVVLEGPLPYEDKDILQILGVASLQKHLSSLNHEWSIVRKVETAVGEIKITVAPAKHSVCARCWRHAAKEGVELCPRCEEVLS